MLQKWIISKYAATLLMLFCLFTLFLFKFVRHLDMYAPAIFTLAYVVRAQYLNFVIIAQNARSFTLILDVFAQLRAHFSRKLVFKLFGKHSE